MAPNYNLESSLAQRLKEKILLSSENKLRNEDKKTIKKIEDKQFHIELCCLNFSRKLNFNFSHFSQQNFGKHGHFSAREEREKKEEISFQEGKGARESFHFRSHVKKTR